MGVDVELLDQIDRQNAAPILIPKQTDRSRRTNLFRRGASGQFEVLRSTVPVPCSVDECEDEVSVPSRGWCTRHYARWKRHGDPTFSRTVRHAPVKKRARRQEYEDRGAVALLAVQWFDLEAGTEAQNAAARALLARGREAEVASNGCWLWLGSLTGGYGRLTVDGRRHPAHRWVWEQVHGALTDSFVIDHRCHNMDPTCRQEVNCQHRRCVNPEHLEPTSARVNTIRGKRRPVSGQARTRASLKVSVEEILQMRELAAAGLSREAISTQVHRSYGTVFKYCKAA